MEYKLSEIVVYFMSDILVKGADYKDQKVVGSDVVKEVRLVEFIEGKSTTKIIERAQLTC